MRATWLAHVSFAACLAFAVGLVGGCESESGGSDAGATDTAGDGTGADGAVTVIPATLLINEVGADMKQQGVPCAGSLAGSDWLELYNAGTETMALEGYRVGDDAADFATAGLIPPGISIAAKGYLIVYFNLDGLGSPVVAKGLGGSEEAAVFDPAGKLLDSVDWGKGDSPACSSYGRTPDASPAFKTFDKPTPGKPNGK